MDGILESGILVQLGPYGVAVLALFACYFLWQRQTEQFTSLSSKLGDFMNMLRDDIQKSDAKAQSALEEAAATRNDNETALKTMIQANGSFQTHISETRPTREEMNLAIDRVIGSVREVIQPVRDDMLIIKNKLLKMPDG